MGVYKGAGARRPLGAGIGSLGREELISLARAVCGQAAAFALGHGNIHPENIFMSADGSPYLGGRADHAPGEWTTDELEYMAPELFWTGQGDLRSDVYSIGLLLYAGVTRGRLPFFAMPAAGMTNELRASALRRRMNGDAVPIPTIAGDKLGAVLKKALAFKAEERYADTVELSMALEPCVGEGDAAAMSMFGKPERALSEVERTMAGILASYSLDDVAGVPEPEPKKPASPEPEPAAHPGPAGQIDWQRELDFGREKEPARKPAAASPVIDWINEINYGRERPETPPEAKSAPPERAGAEPEPRPEAPGTEDNAPPAQKPVTEGGQPPRRSPRAEKAAMREAERRERFLEPIEFETEQERSEAEREKRHGRGLVLFIVLLCLGAAALALALNFILPSLYPEEPLGPASPSALPTTVHTPAPAPTLTPSPSPTAGPEPVYEAVAGDYSWTEAEELCRERGGRLAVIHSAQELEEVTALAEAQGIEFLWLGFSRVDGEIRWLDGSEGYFVWSEGEPSVTDTDGTREDYGLLWHTDAGWFYNDSRNDPAADYPDIYGGRLGFVCETAA